MRYTARAPQVEAKTVEVDGVEQVALSSIGKDPLELVLPAPIFAALYAPVAPPAKPKPKPGLPRRRAESRPRAYADKPGPADKSPSLPAAVIRAVRERPRTTGELIDRVMGLIAGASRGGASSAIHVVKERGRIEKRLDENTGLDKWFLVRGE